MSSQVSSIRSGDTRLLSDVLPDWILDEQNTWDNDDFISLDALMKEQQLPRFLTQLHSIPFYRYMTRYLLNRYPELWQESPEVCHLPTEERQAAFIQLVFAEVQRNRKSKPLQNRLTQRVFSDFTANGCAADDSHIIGSLVDTDVQWDFARLREMLFGDTIHDRPLFVLAIGLRMSTEDLSSFLQKVLLRRSLDALIPEEAFLQICLQKGTGDLLSLYRALLDTYNTCVASKPRSQVQLHDAMDNDAVARLARFLAQSGTIGTITPELRKWISHYKYVLTNYDFSKRPETLRFLKLMEGVRSMLDLEIREYAEGRAEAPAGTVRIYYPPDSQLTLPAGTCFLDQDGNIVAESLQEVSTVESGQEHEITLEVFSKEPLVQPGKELEKHQPFCCQLTDDSNLILWNKSKIKKEGTKEPNGERYQRATLVGRSLAGVDIPANTEFTCGNHTLINRERFSSCYIDVPVEACRVPGKNVYPDAIPRNTIQSLQLPAKHQGIVLDIKHSRLTRRNRSETNRSLCMEYLYSATSISHHIDTLSEIAGDESFYAQLLSPILQGKRLTDTRISQLRILGAPALKRHELLTISFLYYLSPQQQAQQQQDAISSDAWEQAQYMQALVNRELTECGFHPLYLPNAYDCLLAYLTLCGEPIQTYRFLWGILRKANQEAEGSR